MHLVHSVKMRWWRTACWCAANTHGWAMDPMLLQEPLELHRDVTLSLAGLNNRVGADRSPASVRIIRVASVSVDACKGSG